MHRPVSGSPAAPKKPLDDPWKIGLTNLPQVLGRIPPRSTAHQSCERALRHAVLTGEFPPGERIPPERELATTLGVSRLTLRSALAALTAQGVLAVRHGSGYVVQDAMRTGSSDLLVDLVALATESRRLAPFCAELLRVRRHLARAVLEHLVEFPPDRFHIRAFERAVDVMEEASRDGSALEQVAAADLRVVAALLDATSSPVLRLCMNPVITVVTHSAALRVVLYAEPLTNVAAWRTIQQWLARPAAPDALLALLESRDAAAVQALAHFDQRISNVPSVVRPRAARRSRSRRR